MAKTKRKKKKSSDDLNVTYTYEVYRGQDLTPYTDESTEKIFNL